MPVYGLRPDDVVTDAAGNVQTGATLTLHATQADAQSGASPLATVTTSAGRWSADVSAVPVWVRTPNGAVYEIADFSAKADKTYVDTQITGLSSTFVPQWKPGTAYAAGQLVVSPDGQIVKANAAFTSGATYDASKWTATTGSGGGPIVPPPSGFAFSSLTLPTVRRMGGGRFLADLNVEALRPPTGVTYYVDPAGVDTNTGLSAASPLTIAGALGKADVGTIVYAPGEYFRNTNTTAQTSKSINHLAAGPGVKVTGWNSPSSTTWTLTSGSIYQTSRSSTAQVVDVNNRTARGDYTVYTKKADLASITGPGQWAIVGSTVYVWCTGNTDLTVIANRYQIRLGLSATYTGLNLTGGTSYVRGIDFEGQAYGTAVSGGALLVAEDCTFRYSLVDGVPVSGSKFVGVRCTASSNATDGFSYADGNSIACNFIEVNCRGYNNGATPGSSTNNATTCHGTSRGLRVGGSYFEAGGPTVGDVNAARTWNLGCYAGGNTAPDAQNHSWRTDAVGFEATPAEMWLDECTSDTATYGYKVTGGAKIHLHATTPGNRNATDTSGSGVIDYYATAA